MSQTSASIQPPTFKTFTFAPGAPLFFGPRLPIRQVTFVESNYIVTGPANEIDELVEEASAERGIESYLVAELDLGYVQSLLTGDWDVPWYHAMDANDSLVMRLYKIIGTDTTPDDEPPREMQLIGDISQRSASRQKHVYTDLDYLVDGICGDPWTAEGSPWSKWVCCGIEGVLPPIARKAFKAQWAFADTAGIGLFDGPTRTVEYTGKGVRVGVFDTSPESLPGPKHYGWATHGGLDLTIEQVKPFEHEGIYAAAEQVNYLIEPPFEPEDHGLFVAGLIHGVAPDSDIRLYRVLDGERKGDLFTLNYCLHNFIRGVVQDLGVLSGAVINLSLGSSPLSQPPPFAPDLLVKQNLHPVSLHTLLTAAHSHGIVVTAASGNGGKLLASAVPQNPAQSPDTLAVAASDKAGGQACFSQNGNVCAPGGGGTGQACQLPTPQEAPKQWLMSLISRPRDFSEWVQAMKEGLHQLQTQPLSSFKWGQLLFPGYAYAAGTSFSTPLVSGLAALLFEAGVDDSQTAKRWISSDKVHTIIAQNTYGQAKVIHVPNAVQAAEDA